MSILGRFLVLSLLAAGVLFAATGSQDVSAQQEAGVPVATPTPPIEEEEGIIKVDTEAVNVLFTAQDKSRRLLLNLKPEDINIFENGQQQEIVSFTRQIDLPLSLALLIDTSVSQERTLPEEKRAAISFLNEVIRPSKDEVAIVSFASETTLEIGMTGNLARLRRAVDGVKLEMPSGYIGGGVVAAGGIGTPPISGDNASARGSTALWDALWITGEEVLGPAPEKTRRAVILLSDGVNYGGRKKLNDAIQSALRAEAIIYSIGIGDNFYSGVDKGALEKVSESTGGRAYFPRDENDLRDAFRQIQEEMRSQYLLAYEPSNSALDGSYRKIEIKLASQEMQKQKIKLTHRQGYFAKGGQK
jgi:Ca-activated chloride channel family protein